jgi:UDP-3-O-[3-hydroxymyristoyl] glucosamine N-acyltransferase
MIPLRELAQLLGVELRGSDADRGVAAVAGIHNAAPGTLVFAEDPDTFAAAAASAAAAILVSPRVACAGSASSKPILLCAQPRLAFARAAKLLVGAQEASPGRSVAIHPTAVVADSAHLAAGVTIGAQAVLEEQVRVGAGSIVGAVRLSATES